MKPLASMVLATAMIGCLMGAIQVKKFVGELKTSDGWLLAEKNGRVVLVAANGPGMPTPRDVEPVWHISLPQLQTPEGQYLAIDETDAGIRLSLSVKKTASTRWMLDVVSSTPAKHPKKGSVDERQMLEGSSTKSFRLRLFDGPHENWFLAAEPVKADADAKSKSKPTYREWRITQDPKQAIQFDYVDAHYSIHHK